MYCFLDGVVLLSLHALVLILHHLLLNIVLVLSVGDSGVSFVLGDLLPRHETLDIWDILRSIGRVGSDHVVDESSVGING